mgnify:CR=1 FL=1
MIILHPEEMHDMIEKKLEITNMRYTHLTQAACAGAAMFPEWMRCQIYIRNIILYSGDNESWRKEG